MNTLTNKRIAGIDIVKTLAVFFVVCVHFFLNSKYYSAPVDSLNIVLQAYVRRIVLTAVPLFIMSTGFLEYKKAYTKVFYKKLLKVIVPYVLITLIFVVLRSFGSDTLDLKTAVKSFFDFSGINYAWYVNMYIGLFLMMPIFNAAISSLDRKVFQRISSITLYIYLFSTLSDKAVYKIIYNNFIDKSDISAQSEMFVRFFIPAVLSSFLLALTAALIFDICYRNLKKLIGFISKKTGLAAFIEKKSLQREEKRKIKEEAKEKEEVLSVQ